MTPESIKGHIARCSQSASELTASAEECRAKLATAVALQDDFDVEFYTARVAFYVAQAAQMEKNADNYRRMLSKQEPAADASADEGIALVQPETVAATLDALADAIAAADAEVWRDNERGGEGHHVDAADAWSGLYRRFCDAIDAGDLGEVQRVVAKVEEMAA